VADWLFNLEPTVRAQTAAFCCAAAGGAQLHGGRDLAQEPDKVASIVMLGNVAAIVFVPIALTLGLT